MHEKSRHITPSATVSFKRVALKVSGIRTIIKIRKSTGKKRLRTRRGGGLPEKSKTGVEKKDEELIKRSNRLYGGIQKLLDVPFPQVLLHLKVNVTCSFFASVVSFSTFLNYLQHIVGIKNMSYWSAQM